jgi:outer membrane receptor protein involved in Fe transport
MTGFGRFIHRSREPMMFRRPATTGLETVAIIACSLGSATSHALTVAEPFALDLPAGPLGPMLIEIATRAGVITSFNPSLVGPRHAPALRGEFTLQQALEQALQGTGLVAEITEGVVTIAAAQAAGRPRISPAAPASVPAPAEPPTPATTALAPAVVHGSVELPADDGLRPLRASAATRTDAPVAELPQAVSVVTREALELQGAFATTTDALRQVTGVNAQASRNVSQGMAASLMVRGLPVLYSLSGMRTLRGWLPIDNVLVERIEVPKGPSGVIGGVADFGGRGGVVNVVRKSADGVSRAQATQSIASSDGGSFYTSADLGGTARSTSWRLAGVGSGTGNTDGGYEPQHGAGLVGAVAWRGAMLDAELSTLVDRRRIAPAPAARGTIGTDDFGFSSLKNGQFPAVDRSDHLRWDYAGVDLDVAWALSPQWRMTWKGRLESLDSEAAHHRYWETEAKTSGVMLLRQDMSTRNAGLQWGLAGQLKTGEAEHGLLLAYDTDRWRTVALSGNAIWRFEPDSYEPGVTPLPATPDEGDPEATTRQETRMRRQALLLQDQLSFGPWRLRLALQRVHTPEFYDVVSRQGPDATNRDFGVLYQLTPTLSVYAGHQYSQETDGRIIDFDLFDGTMAPPRKLRQTQAGLKFDWPQQRLAFTVEGFALRQLDTLHSSSQLPGTGIYKLPGRRVDGLEAELAGRPLRQLDLHLGLTFLRATDTAPVPDTTEPRGVEVQATGTPRRALQMLARYRLVDDREASQAIGIAFQAYSARWAMAPDPFSDARGLRLPGGARFDLSWTRTSGPWSLGLAVQNVADRRLYGEQAAPDYVPLEPGRRVILSLRYED